MFLRLFLLLLAISPLVEAGKKVLYFTHEPGKYHKYTPQKEMFIKLAKRAGWDLTVSTGEHEPQVLKLRDPKLTEGYDAVIYNYCFAKSQDLKAVSNVIAQTKEKGTPAMLIHCSMHSFWGTYKFGKETSDRSANKKAQPLPELLAQWDKENPGKDFPFWGDFTGVASTGHGPKTPIKVSKCCEHDSTQSLDSKGYTTVNAELYNNFYVTDSVKPLLKGHQESYPKSYYKKMKSGKKLTEADKVKNKAEAIVMWQVPQGKSEVLGLSLGHGEEEWNQPEFQNLVIDGVNYLLK